MRDDKRILLVAQKNPADDDPAMDAIYEVGTLAQVLQLLKLPDGTVKVLVEGIERAKIERFTAHRVLFGRSGACCPSVIANEQETEALARTAVSQFESYVKLNKKVPQEVLASLGQITDFAKLSDTIAAHLAIKITEKQEILEMQSVQDRLEKAFALMEGEISVLAGRKAHPQPRQAADGEDAARVLSE